MIRTRIVKILLLFTAFSIGGFAEVLLDYRDYLGFIVLAVCGSLLCQFGLDVYFRARLTEYEAEARKAYVAAVWRREDD